MSKKRNSTSSSYIFRNDYSFCFRLVVPKDLRELFGKTEFRYSLRTGRLTDRGRGSFTGRDLQQNMKSRFPKKRDLEPGLEDLIERGYIRDDMPMRSRGKTYSVNTRIL